MARRTRATTRRTPSSLLALLLVIVLGSTACDLPAQQGMVEFPNAMPALNARVEAPALAVTYTKHLAGSVFVDIVDSSGTVVESSRTATSRFEIPSGTYRVRVVEEGPVSSSANSAHSGAAAVLSDSFSHTAGSTTTVSCNASGCSIS